MGDDCVHRRGRGNGVDNLCMSNLIWHCQWGADWFDWMPIPACYLKAGTKNCSSEVCKDAKGETEIKFYAL